ncbi:MAG: DUF2461 domain-containing protein [Deltaproteobacteria bacterium]|nr:DUF2461 domain-containing protein [Deltaproteobacteria bacterium]
MAFSFKGFPRDSVKFLAALDKNNNRDWFKAHKGEYERVLLDPARDFVVAMGERLSGIAPEIQAIPQVDKSIFRLYRDTRFSKDKRPLKTHLAVFMWEGDGAKMESPGFYLHLEKDKLMLAGGMYCFSRDQLPLYRETVNDDTRGPGLVRIIKAGMKTFPNSGDMGMEDYKRVPRGYPKDHPRQQLLKKKGVILAEEGPVPASLFNARAVDYVYKRFEKMQALHEWLKTITGTIIE